MKKSKIRNIIEKSSYVILGAIAIIGIGFGCYKLYNSLFKVEMIEANSNWEDLPPDYENFSRTHSYKVQLQISDNKASNGTAWTWYWKQHQDNANFYDWYLITNFHVVNEAIAYNLNLTKDDLNNNVVVIEDTDKLLDSYHNNYEFIFSRDYLIKQQSFSLWKWKVGTEKDEYIDELGGSRSMARNAITQLSIIVDFENDNINLFSELDSTQKNVQAYNLDMSLIKITFDFTRYKNPNVPSLSPVVNWQNTLINSREKIYDENLKVFIAGNPTEKNKLVGVEIASKFIPDYKNLESIEDPILKKLKAPYLYSSANYINFPLSGGASGSPVYQDINYPINGNPNSVSSIDWNKKVPVGIYWGGQSTNIVMKPSFIPFVVTNQIYGGYNIFNNFIELISSNKL